MNRTNATLTALRRILRVTERHGRDVARSVGLTAVQLRLLKFADDTKDATPKALAQKMQVSQATVTALLDKLVRHGMIERLQSETDRRQKRIVVTQAGAAALINAPDPMQRDFAKRFEALQDWEQAMILAAVERISVLLDAEDIDASPILATGDMIGEDAIESTKPYKN